MAGGRAEGEEVDEEGWADGSEAEDESRFWGVAEDESEAEEGDRVGRTSCEPTTEAEDEVSVRAQPKDVSGRTMTGFRVDYVGEESERGREKR